MNDLKKKLITCMAAIASAAARNDQACLAALQDHGNALIDQIPEPAPIPANDPPVP